MIKQTIKRIVSRNINMVNKNDISNAYEIVALEDLAEEDVPAYELDLTRKWQWEGICKVLLKYDPRYERALRLRVIYGYSFQEIADELNVTYATAKRWYETIVHRLRDRAPKQNWEEQDFATRGRGSASYERVFYRWRWYHETDKWEPYDRAQWAWDELTYLDTLPSAQAKRTR